MELNEHSFAQISCDDLLNLLEDHPIIIDVREQFEYEVSHIPTSINIPMSILDGFQMSRKYPLYIFCARGNRSIKACEYLSGIGYKAVNVVGGMSLWKGPLER